MGLPPVLLLQKGSPCPLSWSLSQPPGCLIAVRASSFSQALVTTYQQIRAAASWLQIQGGDGHMMTDAIQQLQYLFSIIIATLFVIQFKALAICVPSRLLHYETFNWISLSPSPYLKYYCVLTSWTMQTCPGGWGTLGSGGRRMWRGSGVGLMPSPHTCWRDGETDTVCAHSHSISLYFNRYTIVYCSLLVWLPKYRSDTSQVYWPWRWLLRIYRVIQAKYTDH